MKSLLAASLLLVSLAAADGIVIGSAGSPSADPFCAS
jgi:hypothetical protein